MDIALVLSPRYGNGTVTHKDEDPLSFEGEWGGEGRRVPLDLEKV